MGREKAFTLVELSIVIIIVGLIIGAVSAGASVIQQAKIKNLITNIDKYLSATGLFKEQYGQYPGDFTKASAYWSGATNGNGNDLIGEFQHYNTENWQAFYQLMQSGYIEDIKMTGTATAVDNGTGLGINIPSFEYAENAAIQFYSDDLYAKYANTNAILFAAFVVGTQTLHNDPLIPVVDMYNIDIKMDDGKAGVGKIIAIGGSDGSCTAVRPDNGAYNKITSSYLVGTNTYCSAFFAVFDDIWK
jgi:prepilin-type N-terminal cleavage/methylation domain-containing protein